MLVLSRKIGEAIVANGNVEITVLKVTGSTVRLGIRAPQEVRIRRADAGQAAQAGYREIEVPISCLPVAG